MIPLTHCISSPQKKIHHIQLLVAQELAAGVPSWDLTRP